MFQNCAKIASGGTFPPEHRRNSELQKFAQKRPLKHF
jgi:hypothetical protein